MIYWYTGQPGHGKTLHGLDFALNMKDEADAKHAKDPAKYPKRELFICNVRGMDFSKVNATELTPAELRAWCDSPEYIERRDEILREAEGMRAKEKKEFIENELLELHTDACASLDINPRYHNAIILIDEAYEHGMFPKRPPSAALPRHVERMAKHRHTGIDFIGICQSPDTQCDTFLRDLIEEHYHVRRKFGTQWVAIRKFDKFNANAEKATPITVQRKRLPAKRFGLYESTILDTTEKRIPWYYWAFIIGLPAGLGFMYWTFGGMGERFGAAPINPPAVAAGAADKHTKAPADGGAVRHPMTAAQDLERFTPRMPSQPWSAPAYDDLSVSGEPPRLFCMISGDGEDASGKRQPGGCTCLTEQGTRYLLDIALCRTVAIAGQYEPYFDERGSRRMDGDSQQEEYRKELADIGQERAAERATGVGSDTELQARYGRMRNKDAPTVPSTWSM